jgi:hypothetical protein
MLACNLLILKRKNGGEGGIRTLEDRFPPITNGRDNTLKYTMNTTVYITLLQVSQTHPESQSGSEV